jgi:hypothetical protein
VTYYVSRMMKTEGLSSFYRGFTVQLMRNTLLVPIFLSFESLHTGYMGMQAVAANRQSSPPS